MEDGKYVVKPWDVMEREFETDKYGDLRASDGSCYTMYMEERIPKSRIITVKSDMWCYTDVYGNHVSIDVYPAMLRGPYFKYGEDCEVSEDGENWTPAKFRCYTARGVIASTRGFRHIRRRVKKEICKPDIHTLLRDDWRVVQIDNCIFLYHKGVKKYSVTYNTVNDTVEYFTDLSTSSKPIKVDQPDNALHIPEGFEPAYNKNGDLIGCFGSIDGSYLGYYL